MLKREALLYPVEWGRKKHEVANYRNYVNNVQRLASACKSKFYRFRVYMQNVELQLTSKVRKNIIVFTSLPLLHFRTR